MTREQKLNDAFMSGVATALCAEFIEVLKYINGAEPYAEPYYGHLADAIIRELGVPLVTGDIPGVAVILGKAPSNEEAVELVKSYQAQGILVTLVGDVIDQCVEAGLNMGYALRIVPLGKDVTSVIHVVSVALRAALIFGNVTPGDAGALMKYTMDRVPAFVNAFKPLDDVVVACGAGAIALGFPVVTNETENIFRVPKSLIVQEDVSKFNAPLLRHVTLRLRLPRLISRYPSHLHSRARSSVEVICRLSSTVPEKTASSWFAPKTQARLRITSSLSSDRTSIRWK